LSPGETTSNGFLTRVAANAARSYIFLTLLCAALFLPGLASIPPTDRDESRFMQATKQMLESGDWVHIRFQDEPRNKKPVGIYWLQAVAVRALGQDLTTAWPYRIPSVLAAWLAVLAVCRCGRLLFNPEAGLIAGAMVATSFIVVVEAHIAKTDATLFAATTIAMTMLTEIYLGRASLGAALVFWAGIGVGVLIKGPLILLTAGAAIAALCVADRSARLLKALRAVYGLPLVLAIVLPWLIAVSGGDQGNFIAASVTQDLLPKLIGGQESHGAPPGSYVLAGLLTAWPWSLLAPFTLVLAWRARGVPQVRFLLAWLIPAWVVFELVPTKLPHYTMALYPALMLLIAWSLTGTTTVSSWLECKWGLAYRIVWAVLAVGFGVGIVMAARQFGDGVLWGAALSVAAALAAGLFALVGIVRASTKSTVGVLALIAVIFCFSLTAGVLPHLRELDISTRLAEALQDRTGPIALAGYHEPSAVFLLGTETLLTDIPGASAHLLGKPGAVAVVPAGEIEQVRAALIAAGQNLVQGTEVTGFNYSRGDWVQFVLVKAGP